MLAALAKKGKYGGQSIPAFRGRRPSRLYFWSRGSTWSVRAENDLDSLHAWLFRPPMAGGLHEGSDFYVANRGDNTIVRMRQDGGVVAIRRVSIGRDLLDEVRLNGIASARDGTKIYLTYTGPDEEQGGVLEVSAFS